MIHAGYLAPSCWDQSMISRLFDGLLYPHGLDIRRVEGYPNSDGCILTVPGKYWAEHTEQVTEAIATYRWVLAFRVSDEEDWFDIAKVRHPNLKWWVQYARTDRDYGDARLLGVGYTPHMRNLAADPPSKTLEVFLAAQDTHERRHECFAELDAWHEAHTDETSHRSSHLIKRTAGFTQGISATEYRVEMQAARVAPCPSGAQTPDSFRVYEALESHAVPIADDVSPVYDSAGYWRRMFPDAPFPVLTDYESLPGYVDAVLGDWPQCANRVAAWWIRQKRAMAHWLREDLDKLGALR